MNLAIVQNKSTQFDEPLYKKLSAKSDIILMVYYTSPSTVKHMIDPETGQLPSWRDGESESYPVCRRQAGFIGGIRLLYMILNGNHDLVILGGYNSRLHLLIALACRFFGIPTGLRTDNVMIYRKNTDWKWKFKDYFYPSLFKLFSTAHPTGSLAADYLERYGFAKNRMFIFPYNVDNEKLEHLRSESLPRQESIRLSLGIGPADRIVLGVLKFIDREDPLTLLDGFEIVSHEYSNIHLLLVGDGELRNVLEERIVARGIINVHLTGYVPYPDLPCYYGMADIFVHPVKVGSWEVSVNEAMVCGLPVIASDHVGSAYDLIDPGKSGYVFDTGSPVSLAEKLRLVLDQPDFKLQCHSHLQEIMSRWNYDQTINNLYQALRHINGISA